MELPGGLQERKRVSIEDEQVTNHNKIDEDSPQITLRYDRYDLR